MPLIATGITFKVPEGGELRNPVALIHTLRAPNNDWGFDKSITPYWKGWARWQVGQGKFVEPGVSEEYITDVFTIRWHPGLELKDFDFLVWGPAENETGYYKVQGHIRIGQNKDYEVLFTTKYETVSSEPYTDTRETPQPAIDPQNPFW